jgi:hypothetical protein
MMTRIIRVLVLLFLLTGTLYAQDSFEQHEINRLTAQCLFGDESGDDSADTPLAGLCRDYAICLIENPVSTADCQINAVVSLYEMCQQEDRDNCEIYSLLRLNTLNLPYTLLSTVEQEKRDSALRQYATGDADTALALMQEIFDDNGRFMRTYQFLLPVAYGVLQHENSLYAESIDSYNFSIEQQYDNPLAYYFRSQAYTRLNNIERATRDACTYQAQADANLQATFAPLPTDCNEPVTENWIAYPMMAATFSPGGTELFDATLMDAVPVRLAVLDDNVLALSSLTSAEDDTLEYLESAESFDDTSYAAHFFQSLNADGYGLIRAVQGYPGLCCSAGSNILVVEDGSRYLYERVDLSGGEAATTFWGLLLPADAPNPRAALPERTCEGLPRSNLSIGETIRPLHGMQPVRIYPEPDTAGESEVLTWNHPPYPAQTIQEGPVCTDDSIWWRVADNNDNDVSGWVQEAENMQYYLLPDGYRIPMQIQDVFTIDESDLNFAPIKGRIGLSL